MTQVNGLDPRSWKYRSSADEGLHSVVAPDNSICLDFSPQSRRRRVLVDRFRVHHDTIQIKYQSVYRGHLLFNKYIQNISKTACLKDALGSPAGDDGE